MQKRPIQLQKLMTNTLLTSLVIILTICCFGFHSQNKPIKKLKHIVTVTFTNNAPQNEIDEVDKSFRALSKLKVVRGYEWGIAPVTDLNKENKHTYAFVFDSLEDLDKYAKSPEHKNHIKVGVSITKKVDAVQYFVEH